MSKHLKSSQLYTQAEKHKRENCKSVRVLWKKLSSLGFGVRQIFAAGVIAAVTMVIRVVVAMAASSMAMELHVPLKAGPALVAMEHAGG